MFYYCKEKKRKKKEVNKKHVKALLMQTINDGFDESFRILLIIKILLKAEVIIK